MTVGGAVGGNAGVDGSVLYATSVDATPGGSLVTIRCLLNNSKVT